MKEERTEMERLLKELEEKDLLLAEYRKRDEESRAEAARLRSDYDDMKEFCDSFREEIEKLLGFKMDWQRLDTAKASRKEPTRLR